MFLRATAAAIVSVLFCACRGGGTAPPLTNQGPPPPPPPPPSHFAEFLLPSNAQPTGIAFGADGNLWFAIPDDSVVDRITPNGKVTVFTPTGYSVDGGVAVGSDGNIWFTAGGGIVLPSGTASVGRITPDGTIALFPIPAPGRVFSLSGIALGP
jgi:streptogramin lyase